MFSILSQSLVFLINDDSQVFTELSNEDGSEESEQKDIEEKDIEELDVEDKENLLIELYSNFNFNTKKLKLLQRFVIKIFSRPSLDIQLPPPK
jgi:hypothetical protein|tara:strand:+ start:1053 stop:1331 length:279 start_codon:yes stop_codon:yes gene_type:complete